MKRREFLSKTSKTIITGVCCSSLGSLNSLAFEEKKRQKLLVIKVSDGMDSLMGLNPWLGDRPDQGNLFIDENYNISKSIQGSEINLGPSAISLKNYANDFSIVNGIFMGTDDVGHESAMKYLTMGETNGKNDFIATLATSLYPKKKVRMLTNRSIEASSFQKYINIATPESLVPSESNEGLASIKLNRRSAFSSALNNLISPSSVYDYGKYQDLVTQLESEYSDLNESDRSVLASLITDTVDFVQLEIENNSEITLDSHDDYESNHQRAQKSVWDKISMYFKVLKEKGNYLDNLTIVVLNDFSRLPFLNSAKGKDHNFFENSVLVAGGNLKGGKVIGNTTLINKNNSRANSQRSGIPYDFKAQKSVNLKADLDANKTAKYYADHKDIGMIRPNNLWATVAKSFGIKADNIKSLPKDSKSFDRLLK